MARVLSADEVLAMPSGHGWMEYRPDEEDGEVGPEAWKDYYLLETVWIQKNQMLVDCRGFASIGHQFGADDRYGRDWRIWDQEPTEEEAKAVSWDAEGAAGRGDAQGGEGQERG